MGSWQTMMTVGMVVLSTISIQIRPATAESAPTVRELRRDLVEKHGISVQTIADVLTIWGISPDQTAEPRLVRWLDGPRRVAVIVAGGAKDEADQLIGSISDTMSTIGRRGEFCTQTVAVTDDGTYSPEIAEQKCLENSPDVVVVIDVSSSVPRKLFQDLHARARSAGEESAWGGLPDLSDDYFTHTSCGARVTVDLDDNALRAGAAYLRPVSRGEKNIQGRDTCLQALPFLILGQPPLHTRKPIGAINQKLLELFYASELEPGITKSEISNLLENSEP